MPRMRLEVRAVLVYDARPEDYETESADKIREIDLQTAEEDVYLFLDNPDTIWNIEITPIEDDA